MAPPENLSLESVKAYLLSNGGRVTNQELVRAFQKFLTDPQNLAQTRELFKDIVNCLAITKVDNDVKYIVLKDKYRPSAASSPSPTQMGPPAKVPVQSRPQNLPSPLTQNSGPRKPHHPISPHEIGLPTMNHSYSCPSIPDDMMDMLRQGDGTIYLQALPSRNAAPQRPPRRKDSMNMKDKRDVNNIQNNNLLQVTGDIQDLPFSPGSVKERVQKIDKMASESELVMQPSPQHATTPTSTVASLNRRRDRNHEDEDTASVTVLDVKQREWMVKAAKADYHSLVRLLKEDSKLATFKDFTNGYTALHWAAKHGNADIVKLIAGTCGANPNAKTHGGYTPLHLAMIHNRTEVADLLLKTYGADPELSDHSGRQPRYYLKENNINSARKITPVQVEVTAPVSQGRAVFLRSALHQSILRPSMRLRRSERKNKHKSLVL